MGGGTPAYRVSRAALNALTRTLAAELSHTGILGWNAVSPAWVATDMGGPGGRAVAAGAASVLWALDLPDSGPTGGSSVMADPSHGHPPEQPQADEGSYLIMRIATTLMRP